MPQKNLFIAVLLIVLTIGGCDASDVTEDGLYRVEPGIIHLDVLGGDTLVEVDGFTMAGSEELLPVFDRELSEGPVIVRAGVPFEVTVVTHTGSCDRPAPTVVTVDGQAATVAVRDSFYYGTCDLAGRFAPRTDQVTFDTPGEATVVIEGVRAGIGIVRPYPEHEIRIPVVVTK